MKYTFKIFAISTLLLMGALMGLSAQQLSDKEADYYTNNIPNNIQVLDNLSGADDGSDSDLITEAINTLSAQGGGYLQINKPTNATYIYVRGVQVLSNVHIKAGPDVTFRPWYGGNAPNNIIMFQFGGKTNVENVAFTNLDEDNTDKESFFKVEFTGDKDSRVKFIDVVAAINFKISGIEFTDCYSVYSNIECNLGKAQSRAEGDLPTQGLIKDVVSYNNHVGYGVVQIRAGKRILFKNLDGEGGITLRIESGFTQQILSDAATIDQVVGRGITIRKGDAALCLSPHRVNQGIIDVSQIRAIESTIAVQVAAGFYDKKGGVDNLGVFNSDSRIYDILEVSGGFNAQVKTKDFKLYNCEQQKTLNENKKNNPDGESTAGYSLAVVRNSADSGCDPSKSGCYTVNIELPDANLVSNTHLGTKLVVYPGVDDIPCNSTKVNKHKKGSANTPIVYPNPNKGKLNIDLNGMRNVRFVAIYSMDGKLQKRKKIDAEVQKFSFNVKDLDKGNYIVSFDEKKKVKVSLT